MKSIALGVLFLAGLAYVQAQEFASDCPAPNGYFADAIQCDKYYHCVEGHLSEKLCPDGMGFNDLNPRVEKCDFLFQIDCSERPELQEAVPTENCPRLNGYFPHPDPKICSKFYYCAGGIGSPITCPEGLAFSLTTGTCVWPDESGRKGCGSTNVLNFTCPTVEDTVAVAHPRYPDPDDCQFFYVCINGKTPRRNGCAFGQVFNTALTACDEPRNVPECSDYYKEYFEEYFSTLNSGTGGQTNPSIIAAALSSGFELPQSVKINTRIKNPSSSSNFNKKRNEELAGATVKPASERTRGTPTNPRTSTRTRTRRPLRPRTRETTSTTTPEPVPIDYYSEYYDYPEYDTAAGAADTAAPATPAATPAPASSLSSRFSFRRPDTKKPV